MARKRGGPFITGKQYGDDDMAGGPVATKPPLAPPPAPTPLGKRLQAAKEGPRAKAPPKKGYY